MVASVAGILNLGTAEGSRSSAAATPPAVAIHSAGRMPRVVPSRPPTSAPSGRVP